MVTPIQTTVVVRGVAASMLVGLNMDSATTVCFDSIQQRTRAFGPLAQRGVCDVEAVPSTPMG